MCTFVCTTCKNKIKEHGTEVDCIWYGLDYPMPEDTTKLYDKSFLCENYSRIDKNTQHQVQKCQCKRAYKYKYDAVKAAKERFEKAGTIQRSYRCKVCGKWHNTTYRGILPFNPIDEFNKMHNQGKFFD